MKYLTKEPIYCTPPTEESEETWERCFGELKGSRNHCTLRSTNNREICKFCAYQECQYHAKQQS